MFGPAHLFTIGLAVVAAGVAWLFLYDAEQKSWRAPKTLEVAVGYAVLAGCMIGILLMMNATSLTGPA